MGSIGLALLAAVTYGTSDFLGGLAARTVDAMRVVFWSQAVGLGLVIVAAPIVGGAPTASDLALGAGAGAAGVLGLVFLYRGLAVGRAAVVAPVSGVMSAIVPAVVGFGLGERPGAMAGLGFGAAVVAVWLASGGRMQPGSGLRYGLIAGVGFGLFFVVLGPVEAAAGLWPLVPARLASIALVGSILRARAWGPVAAGGRRLIGAVGVGDTSANVFILLALQRGPLGEGAVVSSLYPVFTVLLAALVLREAVRARQWVGISLAVVAMALIAG